MRRAALGACPLAAVLAMTSSARAGGDAWVPVSVGSAVLHDADSGRTFAEVAVNEGLGYGLHLGDGIWSLGVLAAATLYVTRGFDLGGVARLATRSFNDVSGDPGVAFDVGLGARLWGDGAFGRAPVQMRFTYVTTGGIELMAVAEPLGLASGVRAPSAGLYVGFDIARLGRGVAAYARGMRN